jgi:hypothetical protein
MNKPLLMFLFLHMERGLQQKSSKNSRAQAQQMQPVQRIIHH